MQARARGIIWAIVGGVIVIGAIVAIVISSLMNQAPTADPTPADSPANTSTPQATTPPTGEYVEADVTERGGVHEPITTDPDFYVRAALAAPSTFDTQLSMRQEWRAYLDT